MAKGDISFEWSGGRWKVRWVDQVWVDGEACDGHCLRDQRIILLDRKMTPPRALEILIHEMVHVIFPAETESVVEDAAQVIGKLLVKAGVPGVGRREGSRE